MNYCKCINYITLFVVSLINIICGFLVMILASVIMADGERFKIVFHVTSVTLLVLTFIGSLIMFVIGIYGCYLTFRQGYHTIPLIIYGVIVLCLAIGDLVVGIRIFTLRNVGEKSIIKHFEAELKKFGDPPPDVTERYVNYIHRELECCGLDSYEDWTNKYSKKKPPQSCCLKGKGCATEIPKNIHQTGCRDLYVVHYRAKTFNCGFAMIIFFFFHVFCAIVGFILAFKQKNYQQRQVMDIYSVHYITNYN